MRVALAIIVLAGVSVAAGQAAGAITVAENARRPALRVDAAGYAEVSWTDGGGSRHTLLIPPKGRYLPGGRLPGADVSRRAGAAIPYKRVVRRTPDGRLWALQEWQVRAGGPRELRFARWQGEPTGVTAAATCCRGDGETVAGVASFQGKPVFGSTPTTAGTRIRVYAYVDCQGCAGAGAGWKRLAGVPPRSPDGSYSLFVAPASLGERYRVTLTGPNLGWTYAPDASATAETAVQPPARAGGEIQVGIRSGG